MRKYLLRYLIFWLPAVTVSCFFNNSTMLSHILQWFFCFFMVFGWAVNTGMAAYRQPRPALAALLVYSGFNIIITVVKYTTDPREGLGVVLRRVGGLFSYNALDIMVRAISQFSIPHELCVLGLVAGCCFVGYVVGLVQRRIHPDPYSPRIRKA